MVSVKAVLLTLSLITTALAGVPTALDRRVVRTCIECTPSPNNCDITAPCASAMGQKLLCGCRPGYRAAGDPHNISKQWRLNFPYHEHRVWVAPGVKCDTLCEQPFGNNSCGEVSFIDKCVVYPTA
ncbi:hypothetical protein EV426DRAFT_714037 [Tirmania nivea]|nr:hypothetical protein EV426DRAFT_714037 [Tirmania nivea]